MNVLFSVKLLALLTRDRERPKVNSAIETTVSIAIHFDWQLKTTAILTIYEGVKWKTNEMKLQIEEDAFPHRAEASEGTQPAPA